jgi:hypothetical protein
MSTTRAESQHPQYGRRRSDTAQSILRSVPSSPLKIGDTKVLNLWVHDTKESGNVLFNQSWWPGVVEGDMLRVTSCNSDGGSGFLFVVPKDDSSLKSMLQVRVSSSRAPGSVFTMEASDFCSPPRRGDFQLEKFWGGHGDQGISTCAVNNLPLMSVSKVDKDKWSADYVEVIFQDQYLGRNDMWRLGRHLVGHCVYAEQDISFIGAIAAKIQSISIGGEKVRILDDRHLIVQSCDRYRLRT